ncbi:MAG: hypothetical protein IKE46_01015 [Selenomonadaceae bacterium]|nr:hypothetical protein [Selenomonadaceae bacterium]
MENDNASSMQSTLGLAVLLDLLVEKGIITEAEFKEKYEEAKKLIIGSLMEEMKKKL